jgi:hypothetical protein
MSSSIPRTRAHRSQQGYALLMVVFLIALMAIAVTAVAPNIITNNKREREEEMIWRGKQYVRGIRLFYGKNRRFPAELEDLYKPKTGIRFLRQAYKDPMNAKDGSWRMIYVGPSGILLGSLKNRTVNLAGQPGAGFGGAVGGGPNSSQQGNSLFGSNNGFGSASSFGSSGNNAPATANNSSSNTTPAGTGTNTGVLPTDPYGDGDPALQPPLPSEGGVIGGNIIGVGSKVNQRSIIWFEKAKNYRQFEFVWDPSTDSLTGARPTINTNTVNPFGQQNPTSPTSPTGTTPPAGPGGGINIDPNANPPLQAPPNP